MYRNFQYLEKYYNIYACMFYNTAYKWDFLDRKVIIITINWAIDFTVITHMLCTSIQITIKYIRYFNLYSIKYT